jgi:hypothetical protein
LYNHLFLLYNLIMGTNLSENSIKPNHKDLPILDEYLRLVVTTAKNPVKTLADSAEVSTGKIYTVINKHKEYIRQKVKEYLKEADVDKLRVLSEIKNIAFSNLSDFGSFAEGEMKFEDWEDLSRAEKACIKDVKITFDKFGNKNVHFVLYDKQRALSDLVKILELSHDVVEHKGNITFEKRLFDA